MSTNIIPISDLRRQVGQVVKTLHEGSDVIYITQHGRPTAVLVDYDKYESLLDELKELKQQQSQAEVMAATEQNSFLALAEMAQDLGVDDLAEQHDHYLYSVDKL
ncbi:MAG TPA: type II toxin-antitoxin system Phd/YefM family antitoxin [Chloroflexota bacterium]|nr:type II toxin-antitoxin system Phd/YefM family antitoxin [Chloroflexota bacterium]HUM72047.1 type II toxin-antitoxin system Phd/YefM family antitoxin [Chloroflexota bacterium]